MCAGSMQAVLLGVVMASCHCARGPRWCGPALRPVAPRDLKAENVLLTKGCAGILVAKLADLGMAQWVPASKSLVPCV